MIAREPRPLYVASLISLSRRRGAETVPGELSELVRELLPHGFEAVGEALAAGSDPVPACAVIGRAYARDGASLGEAMDGLAATYAHCRSAEPSFAAAEALSLAWSEATLEYLHQLSCEDPLTGLASLAHVRTRLAEIYREADNEGGDVRAEHALVVVDTFSSTDDHFGRALMLARVAEAVRTVFGGGETVGRVGHARVTAVVRRRPDLGATVAVLRSYLTELRLGARDVRVWIEGLPSSGESAVLLLDELAR